MVCVNYSDFLEISLSHNLCHFDNIVVVTDKNDINTRQICESAGARCVITHRLHENGDKFNKGKALNDGIVALQRNDWVLITDADMMMPYDFRRQLDARTLNPNCVYGSSRLICPSYEEWLKYLNDESTYLKWKHQKRRINIGVGFFQLVHSNNKQLIDKTNWYSEKYGHCGRSDRKFWRSFPAESRKKLRGIVPVHLGDDDMGANWNGRVTMKWF